MALALVPSRLSRAATLQITLQFFLIMFGESGKGMSCR